MFVSKIIATNNYCLFALELNKTKMRTRKVSDFDLKVFYARSHTNVRRSLMDPYIFNSPLNIK